jgi:uncharacterized protein (UPF0147 family)
MLAPPASRAGVPRSAARARLSEKQQQAAAAANGGASSSGSGGGGGSGSMSVSSLGIDMTNTAFVHVKANGTGAGAGAGGGGKTQVALHQRMVADVEFVVYPFSLIFCDPALEMDYLKSVSSARRVPRHVRRTALAMMVLFAVSIGFDAAAYTRASSGPPPPAGTSDDSSAHQSAYLVRVVLTAVCLLLTLVFAVLGRSISVPYHPLPQTALTALLTAMGGLWAVACVYDNSALLTDVRTTDCAGFLTWLVLLHGCGRFLYFHMSCIPSGVATIVYIVTASLWASSREHATRIAWHCLLPVGCTLVCWFVQYRLELLKRFVHLASLKVELGRREKADLRKEAFDLRDEMYVMTLERYDIADVLDKTRDPAVEFKSPMEQAMAKLQQLSDNKALPKDAFLAVQKVIGLLGNSSDVFKVQVGEALAASKNIRLDDETTRYLFDLVNDNNYEEAPGTSAAVAGVGQQQHAPPILPNGQVPAGSSSSSLLGASGPAGGGHGHGHRKGVLSFGGSEDASADVSGNGIGGGGGGDGGGTLFGFNRSNTRILLPGSVGGGSSLSVPSNVLAKEEKQINEILKNMDTYNFDVFEVANLTGGKPLFFVGTALFKKYNLLHTFRIDRAKLSSFLNVIENGYLKTNVSGVSFCTIAYGLIVSTRAAYSFQRAHVPVSLRCSFDLIACVFSPSSPTTTASMQATLRAPCTTSSTRLCVRTRATSRSWP